MATIQLNTYPATIENGFLSIRFSRFSGKADPMPSRTFEATKLAEVEAEAERMRAEGEATTSTGFVISGRVVNGRAPAGFKTSRIGGHYLTVTLK
jgi:hypothetical protein